MKAEPVEFSDVLNKLVKYLEAEEYLKLMERKCSNSGTSYGLPYGEVREAKDAFEKVFEQYIGQIITNRLRNLG